MKKVTVGGRDFVQVQVTIGRRLLSILLTTFLPTVILNLIGHTANYFKEFFFEVSTHDNSPYNMFKELPKKEDFFLTGRRLGSAMIHL